MYSPTLLQYNNSIFIITSKLCSAIQCTLSYYRGRLYNNKHKPTSNVVTLLLLF